jgi:hypothetical protein
VEGRPSNICGPWGSWCSDNTDQQALRRVKGLSKIEAWDCVDLSWWSDVPPRKNIQVLSWSDTCPGIDYATVEEFECDAADAPDLPHR